MRALPRIVSIVDALHTIFAEMTFESASMIFLMKLEAMSPNGNIANSFILVPGIKVIKPGGLQAA